MGLYKGRELLLYLALKHNGEWEKIFYDIKERTPLNNEDIKQKLSSFNTPYIKIIDEDYPIALKKVYKPPFVIFYYGDISLLNKRCLAVVGSRDCSQYGVEATIKIIKELENNLVIVSGLAKGIDATAHRAIINCGGKTIAVLGCGIDYCYPSENIELYKEIKKNHLIISEYPYSSAPQKHWFPFRNRLIAALGENLLVIEAKETISGTYHTIRAALELGKDIFCIPTMINQQSLTNRLIQEGAFLVENGRDILIEMKII